MNASLFTVLFSALLQYIAINNFDLAPADAKNPTFVVSSRAHAMIDPLDARTLANDGPFIKTLREVVSNGDFNDADKADAFYLMRMKFDWAFIGTTSIPPGYTYHRFVRMQLQTYYRYSEAFGEGVREDVTGLLELARLREPEHIVRASSALLLAAVLDREATRQAVVGLCDPKYVEASVAPPITIHHLALCSVLCDVGDDGLVNLAALASKFPFEESQEDVLLALAYSKSAKAPELIQQFVEEQSPKKFDLAVQLAITIVRSRQKPDEFEKWVQSLAEKVESEQVRKSLLDWAAAEPGPIGPYHPQRGLMKVWDGFSLIIFDDGKQVKFGDKFSGFVPRM
jgi:hypothetical protein